jgi:hypothetical protein
MGLHDFFFALQSGKSSTAEIVGIMLGSPEYEALILARATS